MIDLISMDEVLLADGAWHKIDRGSFRIAEYKIGIASENKVQFDGRTEKDCVASLMACWKEEGRCTFAPVAAVMGYKTAESNGHRR